MISRALLYFTIALGVVLLDGCGAEVSPEATAEARATGEPRPEVYAEVTLTSDLSFFTDNQRKMIALLIDASQVMDDLFWRQAYREDYGDWLASISNADARLYAETNYGPWDRLDNERPFIAGIGPKPLGANFYPADMGKEEFEMAYLPGKTGLYSLIRRDELGALKLVPYHVAYADELKSVAELLRTAAGLAESTDFATYLKLRASALISDNYQMSDLFWMDVKDNEIDFIIGPIEIYEDHLFGYRAAYESALLIKDLDWSAQLAKFADMLPGLQNGLPVPVEYKQEIPGSDSDLNAYDVIYYSGYANAGAKSIAINLPNDEDVQLQKGTRRMQLKNVMRAKFDQILVPIADILVAESQRRHVTFDAFFGYTMFHEVAHGLGIKNTITGAGTVSKALKEVASSVEEGKADILGLYMITELHKAGELGDIDLHDYYVTFMASVFRSVRFGASNAQGQANMVRFNYFLEAGAFKRDAESGRYRIDFDRMHEAVEGLSRLLLTLQGNGDYRGAVELTDTKGIIGEQLQADLGRLAGAEIPIDVIFRQGLSELGLE